MKRFCWLLVCCCSVTLHAQGTGALAKLDKMVEQASKLRTSTATRNISHQLLRSSTAAQRRFAKMEHTVHRSIALTPPGALPVLSYDALPQAQKRYQEVLNSFLAFKKEADVFLYSRAQSASEPPLSPEEIRQWLERIMAQKRALASLRGLIRIKEPSVIEAYNYLNSVMHEVAPQVTPFTVAQPLLQRNDRTYNKNEFLLHHPKMSLFRQALGLLEQTPPIEPLPHGLKILIFNDDPIILQQLLLWYKRGDLFPQQQVVFTQDAYRAFEMVEKNFFKPDVIITDVISRHAMGGVGLAQELRNDRYQGAIIALTGYKEEDIDGPLFLRYGFDGAISNPQGVISSQIIPRLHHSLQYYFYYRNLHGWSH